jgi:hypothetical protein
MLTLFRILAGMVIIMSALTGTGRLILGHSPSGALLLAAAAAAGIVLFMLMRKE